MSAQMAVIAVLEDDPRRIAAIREAGRSCLAGNDIRVFVSARNLIEWLDSGVQNIQLISLDCDLDATLLAGEMAGSGEDVAEYLSKKPPCCPVLIHSSNAMRAPAMHMELAMAGYRVRLCPFTTSADWAADVQMELKEVKPQRGES
jgi:hypothetical protein